MSNADKDILITPNTGQTSQPVVKFVGADNLPIYLHVLDDGTISFEGTAGQLFSVSDSLSGTIFSVNDVSGIPSIEVVDTGEVKLAPTSGFVTVGGAATFSGAVEGTDTTNASSSTTGAFKTAGGLGVAKKAYFGDKITTTAVDVTTGDASTNLLKVFGEGATNGMAISTNWATGDSYLDFRLGGTTTAYNILRLNNSSGGVQLPKTYDSSSATTGALQVSGGVGIAKNLYVGTNLNVAGTPTFTGTNFYHTVTGSATMSVTGTNYASVRVGSAVGYTCAYYLMTGSSSRWGWIKSGSEPGSGNSGSNLDLQSFTDAGAYLDTPISITRSTSTVSFSGVAQAGTSIGITGGPTWTNDSGKWRTTANVRIDGSSLFMVDNSASIWLGGTSDVALTRTGAAAASFTGTLSITGGLSATGTVSLPSTTSIGTVTDTEIGYLDGVTSAIQTQLDGKAASSHTHAQSDITNLTTDLAAKAPLASPALTGTPTAPTATAGTNTTQIATTAFVTTALSAAAGGGGATVSDTAPSSPSAGDQWIDSTTARLYAYIDSTWVEVGPTPQVQGNDANVVVALQVFS